MKDYDNISTTIVSGIPVVTIVGDHAPRFPIKLAIMPSITTKWCLFSKKWCLVVNMKRTQ